MSKIVIIITHPGDAHRDDFIACSLALAVNPEASIRRMDPVFPEYLSDPNVLVLDVGRVHDPKQNCFDHHQLPADADPTCALHMYAEEMGWTEALSLSPWYNYLAMVDSKGPFKTAELIGLPRYPMEMVDPLGNWLVAQFKKVKVLPRDNAMLYDLMSQFGNSLLLGMEHTETLRSKIQVHEVQGVQILVVESEDTRGLGNIKDRDYPDAAGAVFHANRGPGWSLYRYNDDPRLDFAKLNGHPDITFAHVGGFIADTKVRVPLDHALELVGMARVIQE